jgi:polysaccharide deacetylase 2 family uncharacterized protein YibQ
MTMKRKRRRKKGKITPKRFFIRVLLIGCIIAAGFLFYYLNRYKSGSTNSEYEDISSRSSELNRKISRIDHVIYESLYKGKVDAKNIYFSEVTPVNAKDYEWDFTEVTVNIPDQDAASSLGTLINNELLKLSPDVVITGGDAPGLDTVYNISALGLHTHRIRLVCKKAREEIRGGLPKIAIVIDDIGNDSDMASSLMELGLPVTLSVLPSSLYARDIAEKATGKGFEVILHLPMEPKNYPTVNPGPDALLTKMDERRIKAIIDKGLRKVPGVSGVNNHMGSYFTEKEDKMTYVLKELKRRNLFYLDSRTTSNTVGFKLAQKMGIPSGEKSVFLDDDPSRRAVRQQLDRLLGIARYSGTAIGIGHPHEVTLDALKEYASILKKDFQVVPVSELMK